MRVGVVGAGRMGALHARELAGLPEVDDLVLYDTDQEAAARTAKELGASVGGSLVEVLSGVDAVVLSTPATARAEPLLWAAREGLPLFCEKPLAATVEQARELAAAAAGTDARIHVGFQRRCDPEYLLLREQIASGTVGRVLLVRCTAFDHTPPKEGYEATSGDIFTDCLIHDIDAVHWLTGQRTVAVQAGGDRLLDDRPGTALDVASLVLTLSGGARAVLTASRLNPHGYDHRAEVLGTRDSLAVGLGARTPLRRVGVDEPPAASAYTDFTDRFETAYAAEIRAFVRMARYGEASPCTAQEALLAQEVAAAAGRSARTGTRVTVTDGRVLTPAVGTPHHGGTRQA